MKKHKKLISQILNRAVMLCLAISLAMPIPMLAGVADGWNALIEQHWEEGQYWVDYYRVLGYYSQMNSEINYQNSRLLANYGSCVSALNSCRQTADYNYFQETLACQQLYQYPGWNATPTLAAQNANGYQICTWIAETYYEDDLEECGYTECMMLYVSE